jgi:hypothetical protein
MQGPGGLDLARTLAEEHLRTHHADNHRPQTPRNHRIRRWVGSRLIRMGEAVTPRPRDLRLEASTGPPWR